MTYTHIVVSTVNLEAADGQRSNETVRQALAYAFEKNLDVNLLMKGEYYIITPSMLVELVLSQHPATIEQTLPII